MAKTERILVRLVKRLARWVDVPLAEDGPGTLRATPESLVKQAATQSTPDEGLDEAKAKFERWKDVDPFPEIASALLNTADIDDYMRATAMVFPYDAERRKTASYA